MSSKKKKTIAGTTAMIGGVTTSAGVIGLSCATACAVTCGTASGGLIVGVIVSLFGVGTATFLNKYSSVLIGVGILLTLIGTAIAIMSKRKCKSRECCSEHDCCTEENPEKSKKM